jgi:hypothetical protein
MREQSLRSAWRIASAGLAALTMVTAPALGQHGSDASSAKEESRSKESESVVRSFGAEGGYRTEVTSRTRGNLNEEGRRRASLLMAQFFQHIDAARDAIDADDAEAARKEVDKGREAIKAIRTMLPKSTVRTRTVGSDGKVVYKDGREVQAGRMPRFEGMLHTQTLVPILAARRR